MSKKISREDIKKELFYLHYCSSKYRAIYEAFKSNYDRTKYRILKWLIKSDMNNYYEKYQKFLHRFTVVKEISLNYHKFLTGISKKDFKYTDRLEDLMFRLKVQEDLDNLKFNYDEVLSRIDDIRKNYEKSKKSKEVCNERFR